MATQLLDAGSSAASSEDLVVENGTPVTVALNDTDGIVGLGSAVAIQIKDPDGVYFEIGRLTESNPCTVIAAAGTYRFTRIKGDSCGVFSA